MGRLMSLVELPSNTGKVIALDPHAVTAVVPYRGPIAGRGAQVFDMCTLWLHDRSIFVCAWSVEQTLDCLNAARLRDAALFAAGYQAGIADDRMTDDVGAAWERYLESRKPVVS
jgi:hypothetical protein